MVRKLSIVIVMLALILVGVGCDNTTTSSSVGGASLVFGLEINESTLEIAQPSTTFAPKQEIYYVFNNNQAFGSNQLTIQLVNAADDKVLLEQSYDVGADNSIYANTVGFNNPGKYKVKMLIDGKTRAQQELIIE